MNRLPNAGFLELSRGWAASAGLALEADEAVRGDAGRAVLVASGAAASGQALGLATALDARAVLVPGATYEARALLAARLDGAPIAATARVVTYAGGVQARELAMDVRPAPLAAHGEGVLGAPATFRRAVLRFTAAPGETAAALALAAVAPAAGAADLALLRPLIGDVPAGRAAPLNWDPGLHLASDLMLGRWPDVLAPFQAGPGAEAAAGAVEFGSGPGRPASRRTAHDPARRFTGRLRCDPVQRAALDAFWRGGAADFWLVEPGSDRLCVASWAADGQPRMVEPRGPTDMVEVGLWLETA